MDRILKIIAPNSCLNCSSVGELLCQACQLDLITDTPSICYRCNKLITQFKTCRSCRSSSPIYSLHFATEYDDLSKKLVHRAKIGSSREAIDLMATQIDQSLPLIPFDFIVAVPTASSRVRQRGYDHAGMLAKRLASLRGVKAINVIWKTTQTRQVGADMITRRKQLEGAFRLRPRSSLLKGKSILLVDDVISTGSSLEAAASLLKTVSPKRIYAAVFARNK